MLSQTERYVILTTIHQKGLWAEQMVFAHFATQKDILVFPCLRGVGLCDFMTLNTKTGDVRKYDIKFGGTRWLFNRANKQGNGGMRLIHRVATAKQKKLGIELIYVMKDGTVRETTKRKNNE